MRSRPFRAVFVSAVLALLVAAPVAASEEDAVLIANEQSFWAAWKAHDAAPFQQHLAEGTMATTGAGREVGKARTLAMLTSDTCQVAGYTLGEMTVHHFGDSTALITYEATQDAVCAGQKLPEKVLATSVWVKMDGRWQAASYQETVPQAAVAP